MTVGIRTGLCGSITTFSSWMLDVIVLSVGSNLWLNGIGGIIVGICCAIISFLLGTHLALRIDQKYSRESVFAERLAYEGARDDVALGLVDEDDLQQAETELSLQMLERDIPMVTKMSESEISFARKDLYGRRKSSVGLEVHTKSRVEDPKEDDKVVPQWGPQGIDLVVSLALICLTAGAACGIVFQKEHLWLREMWCALLFAPIGCIGRWLLARLNYKLKGQYHWLPFGTFLANIIGVSIDFILSAINLKVATGYWGNLIISSIELGLCGCLTTVSTLVTEVSISSLVLTFLVCLDTHTRVCVCIQLGSLKRYET